MSPATSRALKEELAGFIAAERLISDPLRLLTWGTDASFSRLVPEIAVVVESEDEVRRLLEACARFAAPITFRAAGTSLSGQAITDSVLMAAANSSGGVMGKMIDAQSIVVASTATRWYGHEGAILRYVFWHSLALACLVGLLVLAQAYSGAFPH